MLLAKLGHADRKRWPLEERTAVELVLRALWGATLVEHPSPMGIQTGRLLVGLAELGDPLRPHLDDWDAARGDPATRRAAEQHRRDLELHISSLDRRGFGVPDLFWSARQAAAQELTAWLAAEGRSAEGAGGP